MNGSGSLIRRLFARRTACGVAALTLTVFGVLAASAGGDSSLTITANQGLSPGFDVSIQDYYIRCTGAPVVMSVGAPTGTAVSVDHSALRSGGFSVSVPLTEGQEFSISVRQSSTTSTYYVRCLPADFPNFTFTPENPVPHGLFTIDGLGPYLAAFNTDGVPVWWMKTQAGAFDSQVLPDGTVGFYDAGAGTNEIYSLNGDPIRAVSTVNGPTDVHELQLLPNGDYLVDAYLPKNGVDLSPYGGPSNTTALYGEVEEIAPDGHLVWSWFGGDHLSTSDTPQSWYDQVIPGGPPFDVVHLNSVEANGNELAISMRHTDAAWGVDRATGNVLWKLGGTPNPASLSLSGDPQGSYPFAGNHDVRILPDGTLTLHDNNTGLGLPPRAAHYRIDEQAHTATFLDAVSDPQVPSSFCCGSARMLPNGNWPTSWGGNPIVAEYAPDGTRLFKLDLGNGFSYRAIPVPAGTTTSDLRAGMNAQYPRVDDNLPPVARFAASPNPAALGATVAFDGSASNDPDGAIVSYEWDFGDGTSGSGATPTHVYTKPGDYLVRLTVTDDAGGADIVSHTVAVVGNEVQPPTASFVASPDTAPEGTGIGFDASASQAPGSAIVSYAWRFGDGTSATGMLTGHVYAHTGTYTVMLTITTANALTDTTIRTVHIVAKGHGGPTPSLSVSPRHPRRGQLVTFLGQAFDPAGPVVAYLWKFGDHHHAAGRVVRHNYHHRGRYHVTLTVTDANGASASRTTIVNVG